MSNFLVTSFPILPMPRPVDAISAADIRKWQGDLKSADNQKGKPLSPGYMQNIVVELSSIFNFAVTFYSLSVNPCRITGNAVGKKQKSMNFWTKAEYSRLFIISHSSYARQLEAHTAQAGVKRIRLHDQRHSHASLLIEIGFSALLVSEHLGHENVTTTLNIYSHLFPSKQSEVAEKLQHLCSDSDY